MQELKSSRCRQLLIYIHGFSNLPEDVFAGATEFQRLCDRADKDEVLVIPIVWPCDNDLGIVKDYWDDQKAADQSAYSLARVLEKFLAWRNSEKFNPLHDPCLKRINVLAHSMGNRVLRGTLAAWNRYDLSHGVPLIFRNTFMVAADVVNETLHEGHPGELICHEEDPCDALFLVESGEVEVRAHSDDGSAGEVSRIGPAPRIRRLGRARRLERDRTTPSRVPIPSRAGSPLRGRERQVGAPRPASARATATRRLSPPDSVAGARCIRGPSPRASAWRR